MGPVSLSRVWPGLGGHRDFPARVPAGLSGAHLCHQPRLVGAETASLGKEDATLSQISTQRNALFCTSWALILKNLSAQFSLEAGFYSIKVIEGFCLKSPVKTFGFTVETFVFH